MAIRTYRKALPNTNYGPSTPNSDPVYNYEEMFVVLEQPLLEFTQKDLAFLRERGIDPFAEVPR